MRIFFATTFGLAPLVASAVVATTSQTSPGEEDSLFRYVGQMSGASAVAVGVRSVLTAGHVAAGDFVLDGVRYEVASTEIAPQINGKATDLRIVHIQGILPGWYSVADSVKTKDTLSIVGYGGTGVVNAEGTGYEIEGGGIRRAGVNTLTSKTTNGSGPALISMLDKAGEAAVAGGDSGGGWFVDGELVGISAFTYTKSNKKPAYGFAKKAYFGSGAINLTHTKLRSWIEAENAAYEYSGLPPRAAPVPEPASLSVLGLGAAALLRRRKR